MSILTGEVLTRGEDDQPLTGAEYLDSFEKSLKENYRQLLEYHLSEQPSDLSTTHFLDGWQPKYLCLIKIAKEKGYPLDPLDFARVGILERLQYSNQLISERSEGTPIYFPTINITDFPVHTLYREELSKLVAIANGTPDIQRPIPDIDWFDQSYYQQFSRDTESREVLAIVHASRDYESAASISAAYNFGPEGIIGVEYQVHSIPSI